MQVSELLNKTEIELQKDLQSKSLEYLKLRFALANQELKQSHLILARI